jgi:NIPSNAP
MTSRPDDDLGVFELRQYRLNPGTRDTLVRLFEEHFSEEHDRSGMRVLGQFRDLADPDRFVWLRGFTDMTVRTRALEAFYTSPVWLAHRPAANAAIVDHTDVLLLKPAGPGMGIRFDPRLGPPPDAIETPGGVVVATIVHLTVPPTAEVVDLVARGEDGRGALLARLVTEPARNGYPRLPVREDANVVVTLAAYPSAAAHRAPALISPAIARVEYLRLAPTRRSFLRYPPLL